MTYADKILIEEMPLEGKELRHYNLISLCNKVGSEEAVVAKIPAVLSNKEFKYFVRDLNTRLLKNSEYISTLEIFESIVKKIGTTKMLGEMSIYFKDEFEECLLKFEKELGVQRQIAV